MSHTLLRIATLITDPTYPRLLISLLYSDDIPVPQSG
jgi:hypothetical protein